MKNPSPTQTQGKRKIEWKIEKEDLQKRCPECFYFGGLGHDRFCSKKEAELSANEGEGL